MTKELANLDTYQLVTDALNFGELVTKCEKQMAAISKELEKRGTTVERVLKERETNGSKTTSP